MIVKSEVNLNLLVESAYTKSVSSLDINARFYELGLTRDSRVIPGLTVVSVLSTSNLRLNWD